MRLPEPEGDCRRCRRHSTRGSPTPAPVDTSRRRSAKVVLMHGGAMAFEQLNVKYKSRPDGGADVVAVGALEHGSRWSPSRMRREGAR